MIDWPVAALDPVQRLRALAAGLPWVVFEETVFDAPVARVWDLVGDLVDGVPQFERGVRSVEILHRDGENLTLKTRGPLGVPARFDVVLRPNWCVMRSRYAQIGMAAASEPDGRTRFAHFEGIPRAGALARPILRANIANDFRRIAELTRGD